MFSKVVGPVYTTTGYGRELLLLYVVTNTWYRLTLICVCQMSVNFYFLVVLIYISLIDHPLALPVHWDHVWSEHQGGLSHQPTRVLLP